MDLELFEQGILRGYEERQDGNLLYYTIPAIEADGMFTYGFTSRLGGVSPGDFSSLNLSMTREQSPGNKQENYERAAKAIGFAPETMVLVHYEHGDGICEVGAQDWGKGFTVPTDLPMCDALVIREPNVTAVTLHADCVPIVVTDPEAGIGAVAHAGWKGTVKKLPLKLVEWISKLHGSRHNLRVAIGPHIEECCFEVGPEVRDVFIRQFGPDVVSTAYGSRPHVNLKRAILMQMMEAGLDPGQVTSADLCTHCRADLFYSHRRDHGSTGAMGSFLSMHRR